MLIAAVTLGPSSHETMQSLNGGALELSQEQMLMDEALGAIYDNTVEASLLLISSTIFEIKIRTDSLERFGIWSFKTSIVEARLRSGSLYRVF